MTVNLPATEYHDNTGLIEYSNTGVNYIVDTTSFYLIDTTGFYIVDTGVTAIPLVATVWAEDDSI